MATGRGLVFHFATITHHFTTASPAGVSAHHVCSGSKSDTQLMAALGRKRTLARYVFSRVIGAAHHRDGGDQKRLVRPFEVYLVSYIGTNKRAR